MDLVERYLYAVRKLLPKGQEDDIISELSEDIRSRIDERESELGRPLRAQELEDVIRRYGHPLVFAARFRKRQHLVGPALFPFYWHTLKIGLIATALLHVAIAGAMAIAGRPLQESINLLVRFPATTAVTVFGWITLAFAVGDAVLDRVTLFDKWNPRSLPPIPAQSRTPRMHTVVGLLWSTIFVAWWIAVPHYPVLIFGPGERFLSLGPVWETIFVPVLLVGVAGVALYWIALTRPAQLALQSTIRVVMDIAIAMIAVFVLNGGYPVVVPSAGAGGSPDYSGVASLINLGVTVSLILMVITSIVDLFRDGRRLMQDRADTRGRNA